MDSKAKEHLVIDYFSKVKSDSAMQLIDNNIFCMLPHELKAKIKNKSSELEVIDQKLLK